MDEELLDELYDRLEDAIAGQVTCALQDAMPEALQESLADYEDAIAGQVTCALQDVLPEALAEGLADYEFVLKDGTIVRPRSMMKLLSPDKTKLLLCYGGLRVDGCTLVVQTAIGRWESITCYQSKEEAVAALLKVKEAMEANVPLLEL